MFETARDTLAIGTSTFPQGEREPRGTGTWIDVPECPSPRVRGGISEWGEILQERCWTLDCVPCGLMLMRIRGFQIVCANPNVLVRFGGLADDKEQLRRHRERVNRRLRKLDPEAAALVVYESTRPGIIHGHWLIRTSSSLAQVKSLVRQVGGSTDRAEGFTPGSTCFTYVFKALHEGDLTYPERVARYRQHLRLNPRLCCNTQGFFVDEQGIGATRRRAAGRTTWSGRKRRRAMGLRP